jgi:hypothetical protein
MKKKNPMLKRVQKSELATIFTTKFTSEKILNDMVILS